MHPIIAAAIIAPPRNKARNVCLIDLLLLDRDFSELPLFLTVLPQAAAVHTGTRGLDHAHVCVQVWSIKIIFLFRANLCEERRSARVKD